MVILYRFNFNYEYSGIYNPKFLFSMISVKDWHKRFVQQAKWTRNIRHHLFERVQFKENTSCIEVGCGTGALLNEIPILKTIHGLDIDIERLIYAKEQNPNLLFTAGDAHLLPYPKKFFDVIFCHFLILWVSNPRKVLHEMVRIAKPGAWIFLLAEPDYGGRIDYPEVLQTLGNAQSESLATQGADPRTGRKISGWLSETGVEDIEIGILGGQWKQKISNEEWEIEWQILFSDLKELFPEEILLDFKIKDKEAWENGSRVLFVPTFYAAGRIPK